MDGINVQDEKTSPQAGAYNTFKAPIATLLESLEEENDLTPHDIAQAYSSLYTRIKSLGTVLSDATPLACPALEFLQSHAGEISICIRRDVRRALEDNIAMGEESNRDAAGNVWYPSVVTDDKFRYLKEMVEVSHSALQVVSSFFAFHSLSSLLSGESYSMRCSEYPDLDIVTDIEAILDAVLAVLLTPAIPTPEEQKTRLLSIYALTALHIPPVLVRKKQKELVDAVDSIVNGDTTTAESATLVADALKVNHVTHQVRLLLIHTSQMMHSLLLTHPSVFLNHALAFYPRILALSVSPHLNVRLRAASALAGYANAIVFSYKTDPPCLTTSSSCEKLRSVYRRQTVSFVLSQESQRKQANEDKGGAQASGPR